MNLPNKITLSRIILAIIILIMMVIPWSSLGVEWIVFDSFFGKKMDPISL